MITINLVSNILTSVAVFILTIYNVYYTHQLLILSQQKFKAKVKTKIVMQALTI